MNKLSIVIGHNAVRQGAVMPWNIGGPAWAEGRISEYQFYRTEVIPTLERFLKDYTRIGETKIFYREFQAKNGYATEMREVYHRVNAWEPTVNIELHFNAAGPNATGSETLYARGSKAGRGLAQCMQESMVEAMGTKDRGAKDIPQNGRGGASLWNPIAPSILVEPFFGTSETDRAKVKNLGSSMFAVMFLRGVNNYLALTENK
jgi:N-acetylmuramoyl-L-alanine amidase